MKLALAAAVLFATSLSTGALAQSRVGQSGYVKRILDNKVQMVKIHNELPPICDGDTIRAASTVNNMGTKLVLTGTGDYYDYGAVPTAYDDPEFLNIVAGSTSSLMTTEIWWTDTGRSPVPYNDARVVVNSDRVYYAGTDRRDGDFACGTVTSANIGGRIDYESAMVHEFGHFMGMAHRTDGATGTCVMAQYLNAGQIRRSFCSDETALMRGFYGLR